MAGAHTKPRPYCYSGHMRIPGLARWQIHDRRLKRLDAIQIEAENYRQSARLRLRGVTPSVGSSTRSIGLNLTIEF